MSALLNMLYETFGTLTDETLDIDKLSLHFHLVIQVYF